jgi:hypothetical protein
MLNSVDRILRPIRAGARLKADTFHGLGGRVLLNRGGMEDL